MSADLQRDWEDAVMRQGLSLDLDVCAKLGVSESFIREWALGVLLVGAETVEHFNIRDYSSVDEN